MALIEFKNKPDKSTAINADNLNFNFNEVLNLIYPVGSIMIKEDEIDYSSYLGFEWEKVFAGVTLVGLDTTQTEFNAIGKTGGEKEHTLTLEEMPSHYHELGYDTGALLSAGSERGNAGSGTTYGQGWNTKSIGGSQSHNNLQPYQVVAFWKRIA